MSTKRGRGRPARFAGKKLRHVESLLRQHGLTSVRKIIGARNGTKAAKLRNATHFPKGEQVSMPTLGKIASEAGIEFQRGRVSQIQTASQRKAAAAMVQEHGLGVTIEMLANGEGGVAFKGEKVTVCAATLSAIATEDGVELKRGRRAA